MQSRNDYEGGDFQPVRNRRRRKIIVGPKVDETLNVAKQEVHLHLWRLTPETKEDDVVQYCL